MYSPPAQYVVVPAPEAGPVHAQPALDHAPGIPGTAGGAATGSAGSPVLVTRGERGNAETSEAARLAHIDWLSFTVPWAQDRDWRWMRDCLKDVCEISPEYWAGTNRQWQGYKHLVELVLSGHRGERVSRGRVGWGGDSQRGTLHGALNGQGCARIKDWQQVQAWGESVGAAITRADVAHDDLAGQTVNIIKARKWYELGGFNCSGRPPAVKLIDDLGSGKGKTLYIGNRAFGKQCCIYEKGKQLGAPLSHWCRVEVRFGNKSRVIPWDIVTRPGDYLAGAYPCLAYLSERQDKIRTIKASASITYQQMVRWLKSAAGKGLGVMLNVEGGDAGAVLTQVVREGAPKRLEPYAVMPGVLEEVAHADAEPQ